jgi:hypothetical protein
MRFADREHRYTDRVMGPTIVAAREVATDVRFRELARGEDTAFLEDVMTAGGTIYSADRFNFVQVRSAVGGHSWDVTDAELLASGEVRHYGRAATHVIF